MSEDNKIFIDEMLKGDSDVKTPELVKSDKIKMPSKDSHVIVENVVDTSASSLPRAFPSTVLESSSEERVAGVMATAWKHHRETFLRYAMQILNNALLIENPKADLTRFRGSSNAADKKDASAGFHPGSGSKPVDAGNFSSDKKGGGTVWYLDTTPMNVHATEGACLSSLPVLTATGLQHTVLATLSQSDSSFSKDTSGSFHSTSPEKRSVRTKPKGTWEYVVQPSDTLEKIAASHDVTPSELQILNKMSSRTVFAGQGLFIPNHDYETSESTTPESMTPPTSPVDTRPKLDVPLVKMADKPPDHVPGHVMKISSPKVATSTAIPSKSVIDDEAKNLDIECHQRFIKVKAKYISEDMGVVSGMLIVTPNAIMFDPKATDKLVIENGAETYGVIVTMDTILSAVMYHDPEAMLHQMIRSKKTETQKSVVQQKEDNLGNSLTDVSASSQTQLMDMIQNDNTFHSNTGLIPLRNTVQGSAEREGVSGWNHDTVATFLATVNCTENNPTDTVQSDNNVETSFVFPDGKSLEPKFNSLCAEENKIVSKEELEQKEWSLSNFGRKEKTICDATDPSHEAVKLWEDITEDSLQIKNPSSAEIYQQKSKSLSTRLEEAAITDSTATSVCTDLSVSLLRDASRNIPVCKTFENHLNSPDDKTNYQGKKVESADIREEIAEVGGGELIHQDIKGTENTETNPENLSLKLSEAKEHPLETGTVEAVEHVPGEELRIGNIVYLPVEQNSDGEIIVTGSDQATINNSASTSTPFQAWELVDDTMLTDVLDGSASLKTRGPSGPFSPLRSPAHHLSTIVNYATGLFRSSQDEQHSHVKDMHDLSVSSDINTGSTVAGFEKNDLTSSLTEACKKRSSPKEYENAVTAEERPNLFQPIDKLIGKTNIRDDQPPLYLYIQVSQVQSDRLASTSAPWEAYRHHSKKPRHLFSIPRDKADKLYSFFIQWKPEISSEDINLENQGFVPYDGEMTSDGTRLELVDKYFGGSVVNFTKNWELLSREEAQRRQFSNTESMVMPDLSDESSILTDDQITMLADHLPARTIGYRWILVYSTAKHGYSLQRLYRDMARLDSPVLLVVQDTADYVFGAFVNCPLKVSDHFYGTGECCLWTFQDKFKGPGSMLQMFKWTGENTFFIKGNQDSLAIGAGQGLFGLWLDGDLYHGRSHRCETFDNDVLSSREDFCIKGIEAWAFAN